MIAHKLTLNHTARSYCVLPVDTMPELVDRLMLEPHSPLCNAFRFGNFLFLNDADHIDDDSNFVVMTPARERSKVFTGSWTDSTCGRFAHVAKLRIEFDGLSQANPSFTISTFRIFTWSHLRNTNTACTANRFDRIFLSSPRHGPHISSALKGAQKSLSGIFAFGFV